MRYYNIRRLLEDYPSCKYYLVIGERSNGKTYSALEYCIEKYCRTGEQFAYIRRWGEDVRRKNLMALFSAHNKNGVPQKFSSAKYSGVVYQGGTFRMEVLDKDGKSKPTEDICGYVFDLNGAEHVKSISYPGVTTIVFDEFLSRNGYLPNEFVLFMNVISTIVRERDNVKIIMLGNTVNRSCPYFAEMGLSHVSKQIPGSVDIYRYGDTKLEVAVEYTEPTVKRGGKKSDVYFAFDNPELQMITQGSWEIAIYPHKPCQFKPKDVVFMFFVEFEGEMLQGEVVNTSDGSFIFFHRKTGEIKHPERDIVYTTRASHRWNYRMCLTKQTDNVSLAILKYFRENRVFYADNEVGEVVRNYLLWSDGYDVRN